MTIHPDSAEWVAVLRYDVVGGSLDAIHLRVPAAWAATAELRLAGSEFQLTTETRKDSAFWTITPERPIWGSQRFVLRSSRPLGSDREIVYPEVSPQGRGAADAVLRVVNATGRPLAIESSAGLERIGDSGRFRAREFAIDVGSSIGTFRVSRESWILRAQLPRVGSEAGASQGGGARLAFAEVSIVALSDRSNIGRAVYETVAGTGSDLSIALPPGSSFVWATVDSNCVTPFELSSGTWSIPLDDSRQSRVCLIWRTDSAPSPSSAVSPFDLPRAGSAPVTTLVAINTPTPVAIQGDLGGLEAISAARFEMARADWLSRSIDDFVAKIDRSSGREHAKLISLLISHELALRTAERRNAHGDPARDKGTLDRAERNSEMIRRARAAPIELLRKAKLDDDLAAVQRYLGERAADPARPSPGVAEPNTVDRIRAFGGPTVLLGTVPGIDDPQESLTMTLAHTTWDRAGHSPDGRALIAIILLIAVAFFGISRFRGFWINLVGLITALVLVGFTAGPIALAAGLGLAAAGWKKARG